MHVQYYLYEYKCASISIYFHVYSKLQILENLRGVYSVYSMCIVGVYYVYSSVIRMRVTV